MRNKKKSYGEIKKELSQAKRELKQAEKVLEENEGLACDLEERQVCVGMEFLAEVKLNISKMTDIVDRFAEDLDIPNMAESINDHKTFNDLADSTNERIDKAIAGEVVEDEDEVVVPFRDLGNRKGISREGYKIKK